jgi:alpha-beta hydrolase superfamily lysophospholipase
VNHQEAELTGVGGLRLFTQSWLPDGDVRAVVVIAHGAGEHSGRYAHVAARLVGEGYAVYALDHRGHGKSEGPRTLLDRMDNVVADLDSLVVLAGGEHPGVPLFLLGHSMGGAIALSYTIAHQDRLAGLILSAPLAALEAASPAQRIAAKVLSAVAPRLPVVAVDPSLVSRDPAVVEAYKTDPLVHHGKIPARTVAELAAAVESYPEAVRAITVPTLIMYGGADRLVPPAASVMVNERISSEDKTLKEYEGLFHEILNEPEQEQVIDYLVDWLRPRVTAVAA